MTAYKTYSLRISLVNELEELGEKAQMGFNSSADAVHWAVRQANEKLRQFIVMRQQVNRANDGLKPEVAE